MRTKEEVEKIKTVLPYERLLKLATKMHLYIFLHSGDEEEIYKELEMSQFENEILGSIYITKDGEENKEYTKEFEYVPIEQEIINKIKQCDDFHNRCDCLLEHSECTYLIEYIEALEEKLYGEDKM